MPYSEEFYSKYEPFFGNWKIVKNLGQGTYGTVFEVSMQDESGTYKAAMKAISVPGSESEMHEILSECGTLDNARSYIDGIRRSIENEFILMEELSGHTNIVCYRAHEIHTHNHQKDAEDIPGFDIFILMELLTPLTEKFRDGFFSESEVIKIGIDICRALELCHNYGSAGIIHRDIKPENIFFNKNGDFKLGDFGIARKAERTQAGMTRTGTPIYMAPEVYMGKEYGKTVDIYSLGIVLYRLLNHNRVPFMPNFPMIPSHTDLEIALKKRYLNTESIPYPDGTDSEELCKIILKACAYNPEDRFRTPKEFRTALENIGKGTYTPGNNNPADSSVTVQVPAKTPYIPTSLPPLNTTGVENKKKKKSRRAKDTGRDKAKKKPLFRRILPIAAVVFIVLAIVTAIIAGNVIRDMNDIGDGLEWKIKDNVLIISGQGKMRNWFSSSVDAPWKDEFFTEVLIKSGVTSIGSDAFYMNKRIDKVTLHDNLTHIGKYAFYGCKNLNDINIPQSVLSIGEAAFFECESLTKISLPNSVTEIEDCVFDGCSALESVKLPDSVTKIGESAFAGCSKLTKITISESVTDIGNQAFYNSGLTEIYIPESVKYIGYGVFDGCKNITVSGHSRSKIAEYTALHSINFRAVDK